jgi:hypothetical protein
MIFSFPNLVLLVLGFSQVSKQEDLYFTIAFGILIIKVKYFQ